MGDELDETAHASLDIAKAAISAIPVVGSVLAAGVQAVENAHDRSLTRKHERYVAELLAALRADLDQLQGALDDERLAELIDHGLRRAEASTRDEQIRLAARIVAGATLGASEPVIDRAHLLLDMAADLEPPQVEILVWIEPWRGMDGEAVTYPGQRSIGSHIVYSIERGLPHLAGTVQPLLAGLEARGLVETERVKENWGYLEMVKSPSWRLTDFGRELVDFLRQPTGSSLVAAP